MKKELIFKAVDLHVRAMKILKNERGDGTDAFGILIKIVIGVIIGGILLALMTVAVPDLWNGIINKIKGVFSI